MRDDDRPDLPDVATSRRIDAIFRGLPDPSVVHDTTVLTGRLSYDRRKVREVLAASDLRSDAAERLTVTSALVVELAEWCGTRPPPVHPDDLVLRTYLERPGPGSEVQTAKALDIRTQEVSEALLRGPGPRPSGAGTASRVDVDILLSERPLSEAVDEANVPPYRFWTWLSDAASHLGRPDAHLPIPKPMVNDESEDALLAIAIRGATMTEAAAELGVATDALRASLPTSLPVSSRPGGTGHTLDRSELLNPESSLGGAVSDDIWLTEGDHDWLRQLAELLGRDPTTIPPFAIQPPIDAQLATTTYAIDGRNLDDVADLLGTSIGHVQHSLRAAGVSLRPETMTPGTGIDRSVLMDVDRPLSDALESDRLERSHYDWLSTVAIALGRDPATIAEWGALFSAASSGPLQKAVQLYAVEGRTLHQAADLLGLTTAELSARLRQEGGPGTRPRGVPAIPIDVEVLQDETHDVWDAVSPEARQTSSHHDWLVRLRQWFLTLPSDTSADGGVT